MVVFVCQSILLLQLFLREVGVSLGILFLELGDDSLKSLCASLLLQSLLHYVVGLLIALCAYLLLQLIIVHLVTVFALGVSTQFLHQLVLQCAHRLDGLVSSLEGIEKVRLLYLLHLAFHHHDVLCGGTYHEVHVGVSHLCLCRVDDILTVDACYAHLRDGALEWNI